MGQSDNLRVQPLRVGEYLLYKASVGVTTNMKPSATTWIADNADSLGVDTIWIGEDIDLGQDVFVLSAATLLKSKKIRVGTGIVPVTVHNITTLARAALTLNELSERRFALGIGFGGMQDLQKLGISIEKPVTALRIAVDILKRLWRGETVSIESELFQLEEYSLRLRDPVEIPIFLGVRGPQMLKLGGEISDGLILSGPFDYLRYAVAIVNDSARKVGRNPDDIEKVAWLPTIPTFKGGKEELAKKVVSIVVADTPQKVIDMLDVDKEQVDRLRAAVKERGPLAGIPFVTQELIDMFAISGDIQHMVDRFETLSEIGLTETVLGPPFSGDWRGTMKDIFEEIRTRSSE